MGGVAGARVGTGTTAAGPALRGWIGRTVAATLTHPVRHRTGRTEFIRVTLQKDAVTGLKATSTGMQSSGNLCSMAQADGLLIVPASVAELPAGAVATVQLLDGGFEADSVFMDEGI